MSRNRALDVNVETLLRHDAGLQAIARAIVGEDLAKDAVQQTWLAALGHGPRDMRALPTWLRRVAEQLALMLRRKELHRRRHEMADARPLA